MFSVIFDRILLAALLTVCCLGGAASAQTAADRQYEAGMTSFGLKNYTSAISQWEQLLASHSDYAEKEKVWYSIASAATQSRDNERAITYYGMILDQKDAAGQQVRGPYYEETLFRLGQTLFTQAERLREQNDMTDAKNYALGAAELFNRLYEESPNSANAPVSLWYLTRIAVIYMQNATETRKYAQLGMAKIPTDTTTNQELRKDCEFYYAWALGQLGEVTEARRIFGTLIASGGERGALSLLELAHTYYQSGNASQALSELQRFDSLFPDNKSARRDVLQLQAKCHLQLEDYARATTAISQVIKEQEDSGAEVSVEDYVYLVLCYIQLKEYSKADEFLNYLETRYANTVYDDGIKILRAGYYYARQDYHKAVELINPVLGTTQGTGLGGASTIAFAKRPFNAEADDRNKCGLSEEHFLRAASLLSVCYASMGQQDLAVQVFNAMSQISNELYGRYSGIREKTLQELNQISQMQASTGTGSSTGTISPPAIGGIGSGTTTGGLGSGVVQGSVVRGGAVTSSPTSTVQVGGGNGLAYRVMTSAQQDAEINSCESRAKYDEYVDDVLNDLQLLLENRNLSDFNYARVAILRGQLLYKRKKVADAVEMFHLAYDLIPSEQRDTKTFTLAAYYLGKHAEVSGDYEDAAKYYSEAYQTPDGQGEYSSMLLYRLGTSRLNVAGKRGEAIWCFERIYNTDKTSEFWSHAALQLAIDDYYESEFDRCEEVVDELIARKPDKAILDRVLILKGELALRNKQWDIAAEAFDALCIYAGDSVFTNLAAQKLADAKSRISPTAIR